jgi:hypothetical protein
MSTVNSYAYTLLQGEGGYQKERKTCRLVSSSGKIG